MSAYRPSWLTAILLPVLAAVAGLAPAQAAHAQTPPAPTKAGAPAVKGTVTGKVTNAKTGEPLPFANVVFFRETPEHPEGIPSGGAMAGDDGSYRASIPPGFYIVRFSYISYDQVAVKDVEVKPGGTVTIDGSLTEEAQQIETVKVTAEAVRTAEGSMLTRIKNQGTVQEAMTSEQIEKTTDGNAAEALQRVTGVSLVGGKYIYVRGLGERYSQTQLNGAGLGTPEPNKRVLPLDLFPTDVLDNVIIQKTYSPDMDGEFAGSVISLITKEFAANLFKQSLSLGRVANPSESGYLDYRGGGLDFLGIDDGTRELPDAIKNLAGSKRVSSLNFNAGQIATMGQSLENVWTPKSGSDKTNFSYNGLLSHRFSIFGKKTGFLATASLSNSFNNVRKEENTYTGSNPPTPLTLNDVHESESGVLGGLSTSLSSQVSDSDHLKFNLLYTRQTDDKARIAEGPDNNRGSVVRTTELSYVERGILSTVLTGEHRPPVLDSKLDWNLAYSHAVRNEPDRRTSIYEESAGDSVFRATGAGATHPFTRIFGKSQEDDRSFKLNWTIPLSAEEETKSDFKTGFAYRNRDRATAFRRFGFTSRTKKPGTVIDLSLPAEDLLTGDNIQARTWTLEELTLPNDAYSARQNLKAAYAMVEVPLRPWVRTVAGVRYESSVQNVDAKSLFALKDKGTTVEQRDNTLLPALNLTFEGGKKTNIRAAYSKTLNRPELRELSPFSIYNYESEYLETGDTTLVTTRIDNADLRWEFYPRPGEVLALSGFAKSFDRPITKFVFPNTSGYAVRPANGRDGRLYGWEAEMRLSFLSVWKALDWTADLGPAPLRLMDWGMVVNYSRVHSEMKVLNSQKKLVTIPFEGQAAYSTNAGVFYQHRRWDGSLLYKGFGRRLSAFGFGALPAIYEYPPRSLDLALGYRFSGATRLRFTALNILNDALEFRQGSNITKRYKTGTAIGISVSYQAQGEEDR